MLGKLGIEWSSDKGGGETFKLTGKIGENGGDVDFDFPPFGLPDYEEYGKGLAKKIKDEWGAGEAATSPLILDLDGGGVETLSMSNEIRFDQDGNGFSENQAGLAKMMVFWFWIEIKMVKLILALICLATTPLCHQKLQPLLVFWLLRISMGIHFVFQCPPRLGLGESTLKGHQSRRRGAWRGRISMSRIHVQSTQQAVQPVNARDVGQAGPSAKSARAGDSE